MRIRNPQHLAAWLAAADHIEKYPDSYAFLEGKVYDGKGCMLAWTGHFLGKPELNYMEVAALIGVSENMAQAIEKEIPDGSWHSVTCAVALMRKVAEASV